MLPWFLFSNLLVDVSNSVVASSNLIGKVYFPRLLIPLSASAVAVVDFVLSLGVLFILMLCLSVPPSVNIVFLPFFVLLAILAGLGPALLLTALNVKYRDFRYIIPFLVQLGLYVSPVGFSSAAVPENWRLIYSINPMVGVIDGFRWCLLGNESKIYMSGLTVSLVVTAFFLWLGVHYFRRSERVFADLI